MPGICLMNVNAPNRAEALVTTIVIDKLPCVLGRGPDCDRHIDKDTASRRHCAFTFRDGRVWVEDLGSRNGTFLNGVRLRRARPLLAGDRLTLGGLHLRVCCPEGQEPCGMASSTGAPLQEQGMDSLAPVSCGMRRSNQAR
jgi:pSer/pThr/pTyr-binding forkhead associated (FHA) protein